MSAPLHAFRPGGMDDTCELCGVPANRHPQIAMANVRRVTVTFTVSMWVKDDEVPDPTTADKLLAKAVERSGEAIVEAFVDWAPMQVPVKDEEQIFSVESAIGIGGHSAIAIDTTDDDFAGGAQ